MREGTASDVDRSADQTVDILTRLAAIERLSHVHRLDGVVPANRGLLDNGMFKVNQIGASVSNNNTVWGADRWQVLNTISTPFVNINVQTAVTVPQALGTSRHVLSLQNTTFKTPLSAADYNVIRQGIEGWRLEGLHWGTAAAEPVTLQYLLNVTRAVTVAVQLVFATWRINQLVNLPAGTSRLVVTFPGNTALAVVPDNSAQLYADLWLAAGPTYNDGNPAHILGPVWSNTFTNIQVASGITNYWDQASQQLSLIEAQLEPGTVATPVENRPYDDVYRRCLRYFQRWVQPPLRGVISSATVGTRMAMPFPVPMRAAPTVTLGPSPCSVFDGSATGTVSSISAQYSDTMTAEMDLTCAGAAFTIGRAAALYQSAGEYIDFDARI